MHVALNLLYLLPGIVGGTETYAAGLLGGLATVAPDARFTVLVNREAADWPLPASPRFTRVVCPVHGASRLGRYAWEQSRLPLRLRGPDRPDVLHSLGYVSPLVAPCPSVVTIHDLNYRAFGDRMPFVRRHMLRFFVEQSARRADRVIAVSEFARREMIDTLGVPDERVVVTHHAPRRFAGGDGDTERAARARLGLPPRYLLAFSSATPNKNIRRLLDAFERARAAAGFPHELVLVGHRPPAAPPAAAATGVRFTGYVDDDTLRAVLLGAEALVFPSLYEGFGLPVLEAMGAGVPVACSDVASLPEVGGDATLYFDPRDTASIADAITRLATEAPLRAELTRRGLERAGLFTWERAAESTMAAYRAVVGAA